MTPNNKSWWHIEHAHDPRESSRWKDFKYPVLLLGLPAFLVGCALYALSLL